MKLKRKTWTEEDDERLMRMHRNKVPASQIGKRLGRTEAAVYNRVCGLRKAEQEMREAGVQTRAFKSWSDTEDASLLKMIEEGKSDKDMALALGRTPAAVAKRRNKHTRTQEKTTPTVSGTEAVDFITEAVIEKAVPELMGRFREEMNGHWNDLVKSVVGELKPKMLDSINQAVQQEFALAEFALAARVEEPEAKPTRAERRAERRAARKQAKIERLQQRIQEMND